MPGFSFILSLQKSLVYCAHLKITAAIAVMCAAVVQTNLKRTQIKLYVTNKHVNLHGP